MQAAFVETARVESIADDKVGLSHIDVPSMVEPGATVRAICWWDIEQAVPSKEHPDMYAHHLGLLEKRRADREAIVEPIIGDVDEFSDAACSDEFEALNEFAETAPTTLNGLLAMIIYAGEITDKNADAFDQSSPLFRKHGDRRPGADPGAAMSRIIEFPIADRPVTEGEIDKLRSEAFRNLESGICDCATMAKIAAQMVLAADDGTNRESLFAVAHVFEMLTALKANYNAAWHGEKQRDAP
jgi:hypothetical protein